MDMLDQSHEALLGDGCPADDAAMAPESYITELTADGIPVDAVAPIDREACHRLVLSHRRMVEAMARKYSRLGATEEDLVGEGMLGLLDAARRFDPSRGTKFATYARWWVRYYMRSYLAESRRAVSMPKTRNIVRIRSWVGRTVRDLEQKLGRRVARHEVAEALGVTAEEVAIAQRGITGCDVPVADNDPTEGHVAVFKGPSPEDLAAASEERSRVRAALVRALSLLDEREGQIIRERLLADEPRSLREIGEELGVSRERVRQLEARALAKMRGVFEQANTGGESAAAA